MQVTKNITLDLLETCSPVIIKAKQNDRNTRYIAAHLYVDGLAYPVPSGTEIAFRYKKPDGTAGFYDALPNNSPAITVSGNTVAVELVEQVLTVSGCVHCEINMYNATSEKLTTFTFEIAVEESVLTDAEIISSDYYNVLTEQITKALQAVTDATEQAENAAQSAQNAADSAAMSKDWAAGQPVTYSGTPVSIAYAGANRIDALTLYGENVQGGTTEAPVALTGITSVTVNDDVTELPIPRPLRRVGDVKDKCITRVKRIYDKRIVLDGAEDWKMGSAAGDGAPYIFCDLLNDHYQAFPIISSRFPSTNILASNKNQGIGCWDRSLYLRYDSLFTNVEELKTYLSAHPLTVYYQSTAYDGTNGLDVCLMKYQTGFVELDGTEDVTFHDYGNGKRLFLDLSRSAFGQYSLEFSHGEVVETPTIAGGLAASFNASALYRLQIIGIHDTWTALGVTDTATAKTWLAAQKAAGTPVQIAYQLATPEVYATDPIDFDNAAGPLTVMTGGELEVRMTELVGSRSPWLTHKLDKIGDGSNVTAAFTEAEQDADIASGEKLSVLFGKIKKRFSVVNKLVNGAVYPNLGTNTNFPNPVNQRGATSYTGDGTSPYCIDRWRISNGTTYTVNTHTLTATSYAARACGMWQSNEMGAHQLSIGDDITVSIYANGKLHTPTMKVIDRDLYDAFANVPAGYDCDDFEIVLCTDAKDKTKYNLGIYPKKLLSVNYIKWEKGSAATPYVPKGYGAELEECQRYYIRIPSESAVCGYQSTNYVWYTVSFPEMRIVPTLSVTPGGMKFSDNINLYSVSNWAYSSIRSTRRSLTKTANTSSTVPVNTPLFASNGWFELSADL